MPGLEVDQVSRPNSRKDSNFGYFKDKSGFGAGRLSDRHDGLMTSGARCVSFYVRKHVVDDVENARCCLMSDVVLWGVVEPSGLITCWSEARREEYGT